MSINTPNKCPTNKINKLAHDIVYIMDLMRHWIISIPILLGLVVVGIGSLGKGLGILVAGGYTPPPGWTESEFVPYFPLSIRKNKKGL